MFFVFLIPCFTTIESPNAYMAVFTLPIVLIFGLTVIQRIISYAKEQYSGSLKMPIIIIFCIMLLIIGKNNHKEYFEVQTNHPDSYSHFMHDTYQITEYLKLKKDLMKSLRK